MSNTLTVLEYTKRSLVVRCKDDDVTRNRKEDLKKLGGKYNPYLRKAVGNGREPGWIFHSKDKEKIQAYVDKVNNEFDCMPKTKLTCVSALNRELRRRHSLPPKVLVVLKEDEAPTGRHPRHSRCTSSLMP